jgi:hypothetical protein
MDASKKDFLFPEMKAGERSILACTRVNPWNVTIKFTCIFETFRCRHVLSWVSSTEHGMIDSSLNFTPFKPKINIEFFNRMLAQRNFNACNF